MHFVEGTWDTADKSQSSRHIACAFHLESLQILKSGRHDGGLPATFVGGVQLFNEKMVCPHAFAIAGSKPWKGGME